MAHEHRHGDHNHDAPDLTELLDLDGVVLHRYLDEVTGWVQRWAPVVTRRVLDLGTGTGMGSFALARRFDKAVVTSADASAELLAHLTKTATTLGLAGRVSTQQVDLDAAFPSVADVDVAWSSLAMHHFADPVAVARGVGEVLGAEGIFVVVEMIDSPRFLPDDLGFGTPGLEQRCHAVLAAERAEALPYLGADWRPLLESAGLEIIAEREFAIDPARPYGATANRYARAYLRRIRDGLADRLTAVDLADLDALLDESSPRSVLRRADLEIRGTRQAWIARRPESR